MKKNYILILAAITVLALAAMICPGINSGYADSSVVIYDGAKLTRITDDDAAFLTQYGIDYDTTAPIIVEIDGSAISAESELIEEYGSVYGVLQSQEGKNLVERKNALIAGVKESISQLLPKGSYEFTYEYNTAILGISLRTTVGNMFRIREIEGVSRAYLAQSVTRLETEVSEEPYMLSSGSMIGSQAAYDLGYTGKGTLVAVLDSGLDVTHEAFQGDVPEPKYTRESITEFIKTAALSSGAAAGNTYKTQKVPYAYDYADNDNNVYPVSSDHGMHVSGIVAANSGKIQGVAYDAQIAFMKVFGDDGYSYTDSTMAALDDAIKLGADVVNMSLGLSAGLLEANQSVAETYQRVFESGITLCVAMGNDAYQGFGNVSETNLPLAANPDYGLTATPAAYTASLGVASADNVKIFTQYVESNGLMTNFADTAENTSDMIFERFKGQDLQYEVVPGTGAPSDYEGIDVRGKIALVERGVISFSDKIVNAANAGAIGVLVYDNVDSTSYVGMQIDNRVIPSAFIMRKFGLFLKEQTDKTLRFDEGLVANSSSGGQVSSYSMWGCTSDLRLKPEITAPGGSIYSAVSGNKYESYSGTSMAAPQVAGGAAVLRQYLREIFPEKSEPELSVITKQLLMSTATPIINDNGVITSPRSQGSGMMNLEAAIKTGAYLYTEGSAYAKCELGASEEGTYTFEFFVRNITDKTIVYSLDWTIVTDEAIEIDGVKYVTLKSRELGTEYAVVSVEGLTGDKAVVAPGADTKLTVTITLTEAGKKYIDDDFVNGSFVEGFITLKPETNVTEELSMVFMGFYGDWLAASALDGSIYGDESEIFMQPSAAMLLNMNSGEGLFLGVNQIDGTILGDRIRYSNKLGPAARFSFVLGLRRAVTSVETTITDENGNVVFRNVSEGSGKSFYYNSTGSVIYYFESNGWQAYDETGKAYPDGTKFTCTVEVTPEAGKPADNSANIWSFDFEIDNVAPKIENVEVSLVDGKTYLEFDVSDNDYLQYLQLTDFTNAYTLGDNVVLSDVEKGGTEHVVYDITGLAEEMLEASINPSKIYITVADMALNTTVETAIIGPQLIQIPSAMEIAKGGSRTVELNCYPKSYPTDKLLWSSSDESVVTVANGVVTAVGEGDAVITVSSISGLKAECKVTVKGLADRSVTLDAESKSVTIGGSFTLKATVYPTEATDKTVVWSSGDESIVTVEDGVVKAVGIGTATITATTKYGNTAECVVTVNPIYATEVVVSMSYTEIVIGDTAEITASVKPGNATYKDVDWISSDESVVTVENGIFRAEGLGEATVKAVSKDGKASAEVKVRVLPREVSEILVQDIIGIDIGTSVEIIYDILPSDATYRNVVITSDNDNVTVDGYTVNGVKVGRSVLTLTATNGVTAKISVSVNPVYAESVTLDSTVAVLTRGKTLAVKATVLPEDTTFAKLVWSSSNEEVAIVSQEGVITAVGKGNAVITAETLNGVKATISVTVNEKTYTGIYVTDVYSMNSGESKTLTVDVLPADFDMSDIVWTSTDESVAFVDSNGVLHALKDGSVDIRAEIGNVSYSFRLKVSTPLSALTIILLIVVILFAAVFAVMLIKLRKDKKNKA